jgi:hypothetical protein
LTGFKLISFELILFLLAWSWPALVCTCLQWPALAWLLPLAWPWGKIAAMACRTLDGFIKSHGSHGFAEQLLWPAALVLLFGGSDCPESSMFLRPNSLDKILSLAK